MDIYSLFPHFKRIAIPAVLLVFSFPSSVRGEAPSSKAVSNSTYKPGQSEISAIVGAAVEDKLSVKVTESGKPLAGERVYWSFTQRPANTSGAALASAFSVTGNDGIASTTVTVGDRPGSYQVAAFLPGVTDSPIVFRIHARQPTWLVFLLLKLLGGVAVFLFGIFYMSDSIQKVGGGRFGEIIERYTSNRFKGLAVGTLVTAVIQSSSATTVIVVGLINSGLMQFSQSIGIILGANIGTTITAQIVAFKLTDYALLFVLIGFLVRFISSVKRKRLIGDAIIGFGLLFFGMKIMADVTMPLRSYQPFIELLLNLENPVVGVLAGGVFTAIIRSSSAATGVYIALSFQGLMPLEAAIPLIFGANIGTSTNALLASIGTTRAAKRAALAHVIFNMGKVCIFLPFIPWYRDLIFHISPHPAGATALTTFAQISRYGPRMIANAHTIAKVIAVVLTIPFTPYLARLCTLILPVTEKEKTFRPKYLSDDLLDYPGRAISVTEKEIMRMGTHTLRMVNRIMDILQKRKAALLDEITLEDEKIDILYKEIRPYLSRIAQKELTREESLKASEIVIVAAELENIGDVISKSLISTLTKCVEYNLWFSDEDWIHVVDYHGRVKRAIVSSLEAFRNDDLDKAERLAASTGEMAIYYKALHIAHLQKHYSGVEQTIQMSSHYMNILADFRHLYSLAIIIAQAVIDYKLELGT